MKNASTGCFGLRPFCFFFFFGARKQVLQQRKAPLLHKQLLSCVHVQRIVIHWQLIQKNSRVGSFVLSWKCYGKWYELAYFLLFRPRCAYFFACVVTERSTGPVRFVCGKPYLAITAIGSCTILSPCGLSDVCDNPSLGSGLTQLTFTYRNYVYYCRKQAIVESRPFTPFSIYFNLYLYIFFLLTVNKIDK